MGFLCFWPLLSPVFLSRKTHEWCWLILYPFSPVDTLCLACCKALRYRHLGYGACTQSSPVQEYNDYKATSTLVSNGLLESKFKSSFVCCVTQNVQTTLSVE